MKRTKTVLTAVVLGTVMSLAVSGCTQSGGSGSGGAKQPTLAFIQGVAGDEFYISMECGIKAAEADCCLGCCIKARCDPRGTDRCGCHASTVESGCRSGNQDRSCRHDGQSPIICGIANFQRQLRRRGGGVPSHPGGSPERWKGSCHLHRSGGVYLRC